jgi:hypothetical protein
MLTLSKATHIKFMIAAYIQANLVDIYDKFYGITVNDGPNVIWALKDVENSEEESDSDISFESATGSSGKSYWKPEARILDAIKYLFEYVVMYNYLNRYVILIFFTDVSLAVECLLTSARCILSLKRRILLL